MLKKILIALPVLALCSALLAGVFLKNIGIDPLLWFGMPEKSAFSGKQIGDPLSITLDKTLDGFQQITDFQFFPGSDTDLLVLQKSGELFRVDLQKKHKQLMLDLDVLIDSEQGLLGVAIHPDFPKLPCIYLNTVVSSNNQDTSQVSEWCQAMDGNNERWYENKILLEVGQPFKNHNAGHLIFDSEGLLYIPWGDGGSSADPYDNAQNLQSFLGKILRINPEAFNAELPYSIPPDNPFTGSPEIPDEIYAYGLRNPWKLAFDQQGRLIAADVGQDLWEEVTFIEAGANHGWNMIEGLHCFKKNCSAENTVLPFIEYGHDVGRSVTGGYVYLSEEIPGLKGKYIFGDFVTGQIWAAELPPSDFKAELNLDKQGKRYTKVYQLGQWPLLISSFARDHSGNIYVADFLRGEIFRIAP